MNNNYSYFNYDFYESQDCPNSFPRLEYNRAAAHLGKLRKVKDEGKDWYFNALWQPTYIIESILQAMLLLDEPYTDAEKTFLLACLNNVDMSVSSLAVDVMDYAFEGVSLPYFKAPWDYHSYMMDRWREFLEEHEKSLEEKI